MSVGTDDLRGRMRRLLDQELTARAQSRIGASRNAALGAPGTGAATSGDRLDQDVLRLTAAALRMTEDQIDPAENLANYGIDSIAITEVMGRISRFFGISIAPTTFFEARRLYDLVDILRTRYSKAVADHYGRHSDEEANGRAAHSHLADVSVGRPSDHEANIVAWLARHQSAFNRRQSSAAELAPGQGDFETAVKPLSDPLAGATADPIAIIAMEGIFPRSPDLSAFEAHLRAGDDCIDEVPPERWDWRAVYGDPKKGQFTDVKYGGFITGHDVFDAGFFNISPKEAELMDPQHRLCIECVWRLIESAGYAPGSLSGKKVGLFLGINLQDYTDLANQSGLMDAVQLTGLGHAFCPNRLSFLLDINGPSQVIDTACSSSLVAVHRAVMSIRHEGCEMAIAGGANLMLTPTQHILFSRVGMISRDGRCKTFSRDADGYARADGVGAVLLKRLDRAERDGDQIIGIIRGSSENHGGAASSLTAPNPNAQARLIVEAHLQAAVDPRSISMIECHGTGTPLGDPVEIEGLKTAFNELYRRHGVAASQRPYCGLGSVKSNIGHAETAAGIAGLIKVLLAMRNGTLYRTLHCDNVNPLIDLEGSPFYLLNEARSWTRPVIDGVEAPRRAGLSSFGAGGANAHVVIEEYRPASAPPRRSRGEHSDALVIVPISAKTETALLELVARLKAHLEAPAADEDCDDLTDLSYTLQIGRDALRVRLAFVATDRMDLLRQFGKVLSGDRSGTAFDLVDRKHAAGSPIDPTAASIDLWEIAAEWAKGTPVAWSRLYLDRNPRRIALPTYPFSRKRFWLPRGDSMSLQGHPAVAATPTAGPTILANMQEIERGRFRLHLSGDEFFLRDHKVRGAAVLPGVAYLELMREAAQRAGFAKHRLHQVVWFKPLIVASSTFVEVSIRQHGGRTVQIDVSTVAVEGPRTVYCQARLDDSSPTGGSLAVETPSLSKIEAACPRYHSAVQVYRAFDAMGITYGPAHRAIASLQTGVDDVGRMQVLGRLRMPEVIAATDAGYVLHPSIMDGAFQAAIGMVIDADANVQEQPALPFALESIEILGPCADDMWVHVRAATDRSENAAVRTLHIDVMDERGEARVRMRGFATRVLQEKTGPDIELLVPEWRHMAVAAPGPSGLPAGALRFAARFSVLCEWSHDVVAALAGHLPEGTCRSFAADATSVDGIYLAHAQNLLSLLQQVIKETGPSLRPTLIQVVIPDDEDRQFLAGLSGLLCTAHIEHPWLWGQIITIDAGIEPVALASQLDGYARNPELVHIRHSRLGACVPRWRATTFQGDRSAASVPWQDGKVYLITGGAGAIGRQLAREIKTHAQDAQIILVGRTALGTNREVWLESVNRVGTATITYRSVDIADPRAAVDLVTDIRRRYGKLDGILHAAGVIDDAPLAEKTGAKLAEILAPKVSGTVNLDQAIGASPLDFFVLFASLSGVVGNRGQADYAAANAFMDSFAAMREARRKAGLCRGRTVAVNWPLWRDGGMKMDAATERLVEQTTGLVALGTSDALRIIYEVMASDCAQVAVAVGNLARARKKLFDAPDQTSLSDVSLMSGPRPGNVDVAEAAISDQLRFDPARLHQRMLLALTRCVCDQLKVSADDLAPDIELSEYGFDSISFTQFANELNDRFGLEITPTLFFEYPTLSQLAAHLISVHGDELGRQLGLSLEQSQTIETTGAARPTSTVPIDLDGPVQAIASDVTTQLKSDSAGDQRMPAAGVVCYPAKRNVIAIIGMSGVFPGAEDPDQLWRNLVEGRDCIREVPSDRWEWRTQAGRDASDLGSTYGRWGGFIEGCGEFDAAFFGISAAEARMMDPQQRLLLTQTWRVLEDAGYAPGSLSGANIGVFMGIADTGYGRLIAEAGAPIEGHAMTGLAPSVGPNRVSFTFNFTGPSVAVETACSSALVAVHRAVEAIAGGDCEGAIAGGVNMLLMRDSFIGFGKAGMLARDGRSKPFSARADGYARGEGAGLIFLKTLADAERDGDRILAVIRATAENHGGRAASLTAPNPKAQSALLRRVYCRAGIDPRTVGYIEAHGTGTPLGDPIEVEALTTAFADLSRQAEVEFGEAAPARCGLGSVKSNIGHLEIAAGIAGIIKVLLQIKHQTMAKSIHCDDLNPYLRLEGSPFHVVRENTPWRRVRDAAGRELPLRAGISSFGFGGSNAHVVVEEYAGAKSSVMAVSDPPGPVMIVLSAKTEPQLTLAADRLREALGNLPDDVTAAEIAFTLQTCRDAMEHRLAFVCTTKADLQDRLAAFLEGRHGPEVHTGQVKPNRDTVALLAGDAEVNRSLAGLPARGQHDRLLGLWVRGLAFDWRALYRDGSPRKIALPGYPFAKTVYWVQRTGSADADRGQSKDGIALRFHVGSLAEHLEPAATKVITPVDGDDRVAAAAGFSSAPVPDLEASGYNGAVETSRVLAALTEIAARVLETESSLLDADTELGEFGFDSVLMTKFASKVNEKLALALTPADFFEFATLDRLAHHVIDSLDAPAIGELTRSVLARPAEQIGDTPIVAGSEISASAADGTDDPVAIVGISCRFPMAQDARAFWDNLVTGRDCITEIPADRWDWRAVDGDPKVDGNKTNIRWGGFIDGVYEFDPLFFGISPREAQLMDPQQRLAMIHAWKAIEDAGHSPRELAGRSVGVFVGTASSGFRGPDGESGAGGYVATGTVPSVGPNRISFFLDLHGPSEPVETACSSSLVAIHRAVQAMMAGDCEMALAGGVNTILTPEGHINFARAGMLSVAGRCKTFSAHADGYVRGEGVGMLFLKRLSAAERDRDPIYALIRGSAVNHGGRANSLTAPNTAAQAELLKRAYARAKVDLRTVGYIEAHGTGTALGDPVEINALKSAFGDVCGGLPEVVRAGPFCGIGSVKANIGHLELAAGIAGVIKVLMQLRHRTLAPSLHADPPNPYIDLSHSRFIVVTQPQPWLAMRDAAGRDLPRRAGVSSFGFGGVNAHVILEEYCERITDTFPARAANSPVLIPLSAADPEILLDQARHLVDAIDAGDLEDRKLSAIAYTLQIGRAHMKHRLALVTGSIDDLRERLNALLRGDRGAVFAGTTEPKPSVVLEQQAVHNSLEVVAQHWVRGGEVDWRGMNPVPQSRLRLPTYSFRREQYRMSRPDAIPVEMPTNQSAAVATMAAVPLSALGDIRHVVRLAADSFFLRDHKIRGDHVLPGAMSLELVRQVFARSFGAGAETPVSLGQVIWLKPITVAVGSAVDVTVALSRNQQQGGEFRISTDIGGGPGGVVLHVQGRIAVTAAQPMLRLDASAVRARCPDVLTPNRLYEIYDTIGIHYGPSFRGVQDVRVGHRELLAQLRLPEAAEMEVAEFGLHPSIVDAAFQACLGLLQSDGANGLAIPFALDRIDLFAGTTPEMWAHVREAQLGGSVRKLDIDLADAQGMIRVRVRGFSVRLLGAAGDRETADRQDLASAPTALHAEGVRYFRNLVATETAIPIVKIDESEPLESYGIDSVLITRLTDRLEHDFGSVSKTMFFEHRTLASLVSYFVDVHGTRLAELLAPPVIARPAEATTATGAKVSPISPMRHSPAPQVPQPDKQIAIIGLAGRYPGANTLDELWENLAAGRDCIAEVPESRWDHSRFYDPAGRRPGKTNSKWGGFIDDFDRFDPLFFNISPREAEFMDPQERIFLECAWEALEDAGYTAAGLSRSDASMPGADVGVFVGVMYEEYQLYGAERTQSGQPLALSGSPASIANRVSYVLDFHGPSMAVDSMCSSSLTAIHLACESIRSGGCDAAIAGGVNLTLHPNKYLALAQGSFMSSNGRCESFGRGGDGYVPGEGAGAVLLKSFDRAVADGDHIYGVIRSSALNHGGKTIGYTVPNPRAQAAVIARAIEDAGVEPRFVTYVEAHGTGTALGDPIEISALTSAFRRYTDDRGFCAIGSVKSNIGHCESAAGIAGLTKILLQMKHQRLVPSLHAEVLNPKIDFESSPFVVQRRLETWHRPLDRNGEHPRVAGLSSFGAGGANAHLIIEEYDAPKSAPIPSHPTIVPFSARDEVTLWALIRRFLRVLETIDDDDFLAVAHSLQSGREAFEVRLAVVADSLDVLAIALTRAAAGERDVAHVHQGARRKGADLLQRKCGIAFAVEAQDLDGLAAWWVEGGNVDWATLHKGTSAPRKLSLPTYPFARERYWIPAATEPLVAPAKSDAADHTERAASASPLPLQLPLLFAPFWRDQPAMVECAPADLTVVVLCDFAPDVARLLETRLKPAECCVLDAAPAPIGERFTNYAVRLLELLKRITRERRARPLVQIVCPRDDESALLEGLAGLLRSARYEIQGLRCQIITVDAVDADLPTLLRADQLSGAAEIRHEGGKRLIRCWRETTEGKRQYRGPGPWKGDGVYLITGGTGGLGLLLCKEIARRVRRPKLWVTSRSDLSEIARTTFAEISADVVHRRLDVTRIDDMRAVVDEIRHIHGRIDGIIHAAGITRDKLLVGKSADELREVLGPKVKGLLNLDEVSADCNLDFLLLFGSVSGALGNGGQVDYAAGNAFMDAFAEWRSRKVALGERRGMTLSMNWPYWRGGGMTLEAAALAAMERSFGVRPLETEQAMAALRAATAQARETGLTQILVLDGDHERLRKSMQSLNASSSSGLSPSDSLLRAPEVSRSEKLVTAEGITAYLARKIAEELKLPVDRLDPHEPFDRYGMDSVGSLRIIAALEDDLGPLPKTLLFEYPTLSRLAGVLLEIKGTGCRPSLIEPAAVERPQPIISGDARYPCTDAVASDVAPQDIAVIAVAGRYPGADTIEAFWELLRDGRDCITEIPADRWDQDAIYAPGKGKPGASYCRWGGFLSDVDCFDAAFFGISPRDAALMDPQERLFLETAWHLLERAGHSRETLRRQYECRVGVYVGAMYQQYRDFSTGADDTPLLSLSSYASLANRVSFFFDLQGPSVAVDTMCSSGLEAVHLACRALQHGECRLAIAGGVNLSIHPYKYVGLSRTGMLGSHAESRSFADGDGYLPAEGVGTVLLKPLADAHRDNDTVIGIIKGSYSNHGGHSAGYAVPNAEAQARLIQDNFRASGIDPRTISYVEAAANGSALGDAIEVRALTRAFRAFTPDSGFCAIGSVKSNMGHAEAASGLAQLTKCLLQLQHRQLVPSVRKAPLNPNLSLADTPFVLQSGLDAWEPIVIDGRKYPLRAAVNSFGAGGSNVHLILEEAPRPSAESNSEKRRPRSFRFSARTAEQLGEVLQAMAAFVRSHPDVPLGRFARTLRLGRERLDYWIEFVATDRDELLEKLVAAARLSVQELGGAKDRMPLSADEEDQDDDGPLLVLPPYPFARERYWLAKAPRVPVGAVSATYDRGRTSAEVVDLINGVLGAEIGIAADAVAPDITFRDYGATSMFTLRLIRSVADRLAVTITHRDLETYPTPGALANFITGRMTSLRSPAVPTTATPLAPEVSTRMALSEGQKGLWVLQRLYPEMSGYNVPLAFQLNDVNIAALERAIDVLLTWYPILGRIFEAAEPEPIMTTPAVCPRLKLIDIPTGTDCIAFARERAQVPFDLSVSPATRFELLQSLSTSSGRAIVLVVAHHIVFDGVSAAVVTRALWSAYTCFCKGDTPFAPAPAAEFSEFVAWERDHIASARGQAQLAYWRSRLSGDLPVLALPADRPVNSDGNLSGRSLDSVVPPDLVRSVRRSARALQVNPSIFLLGILKILLYRYTGQYDILVGMPAMGRPALRFEHSVGYFVNMIPVRSQLTGSQPFAAFVKELQVKVTEGLDNSDYPFTTLMRNLGRSLRLQPPYHVTYAYQNFLDDKVLNPRSALHGAGVTHIDSIRQEGDGAFGIEIFEEGDQLRIVAGFDADQFDACTVERMLAHFVNLAASASAQPQAPLAKLEMMSEAERCRIIDWGRGAPAPVRAGLVHEWIRQRAMLAPEATALVCGDCVMSYRDLVDRAQQLADNLRRRGVQTGTIVGVLLDRGSSSIVALLAVLQVGATWLPLDADHPDRRISAILADVSAAAIITDSVMAPRLSQLDHGAPIVLQLNSEPDAVDVLVSEGSTAEIAPDGAAYIIYTSGSSGRPKGVAVSHRALAQHCLVVVERYELTAKDVVLQFASHSVDTALEQILPALVSGARLVMRGPDLWPPIRFVEVIKTHRVSVADVPPAYLREVMRAWSDGPGIVAVHVPRLLIVGGDSLTPETVRLWQQGPFAGAQLLNAYGPTEATITSLVHVVSVEPPGRMVPVGRPLAGASVCILDRDGNCVPEGVIGELYIGGDRLALCYAGQPDLTRERFAVHPLVSLLRDPRLYRTGDLASFIPGTEGVIAFHGRSDDQVKIRGFRTELGDIEAALRDAGLRDVAVLARPGPDGDRVLVAYVARGSAVISEPDLTRALAERLPGYMVPSVFVEVDVIPMTSSGKIDRRALEAIEPHQQHAPTPAAALSPRNEKEARLLRIWQQVLGRESTAGQIGIHDDFFACGGHSLLALRLLAAIQREFGPRLSIADLIGAPTIVRQLQLLQGLRVATDAAGAGSGPEDALVVLRSGGATPVFFVHAAGGSITRYLELARQIETDRTIYGIQSTIRDAQDDKITPDELSSIAARYVATIRHRQPHGPYSLAGWSIGGIIAFEMARQLDAHGEQVGYLGLIDTYAPATLKLIHRHSGHADGDDTEAQAIDAFARDVLADATRCDCDLGADVALHRVEDMLDSPRLGPMLGDVDPERLRAIFEVFKATSRAALNYRPQFQTFPVMLYRASESPLDDVTLGWGSIMRTNLRIRAIAGDHYSILKSPNLKPLADLISSDLVRVAG